MPPPYCHDATRAGCSLSTEGLPPPFFVSCGAEPYSGCSGWVCRPFSGRLTLCWSQNALCSWSSSDLRGRPMSKCIFRFSSNSSSFRKGGLNNDKVNRDSIKTYLPALSRLGNLKNYILKGLALRWTDFVLWIWKNCQVYLKNPSLVF